MKKNNRIGSLLARSRMALFVWLLLGLLLTGCGSFLPSSGMSSSKAVTGHNEKLGVDIEVVDINEDVAQRVFEAQDRSLFSNTIRSARTLMNRVGPGDMVAVSIWEAPPATLFGTSTMAAQGAHSVAGKVSFPQQMVNELGAISIPFAGQIKVAGYSPQEIERKIADRLEGKANQPQVLVRVVRDASSTVTVVGDVAKSIRMPLTPKNERLLDALAASGGPRDSIAKTSIQLTRGHQSHSLPLERVIKDPRQNIRLAAGDVITINSRPYSYSILGAAWRNMEVDFEAKGISLAQALARGGGVKDHVADATGVFIFRFEHPAVLLDEKKSRNAYKHQKMPVIYRLNMKDPGAFLVAQRFPIRDKDVLYVSNASAVGLKKFLSILHSVNGVVRGGMTIVN